MVLHTVAVDVDTRVMTAPGVRSAPGTFRVHLTGSIGGLDEAIEAMRADGWELVAVDVCPGRIDTYTVTLRPRVDGASPACV